jgi:DNA-binding NarL/FixJ family response regulator
VFAAVRAGARGYLTKDAPSTERAEAITTVCQGDAHFDPGVQRRLVSLVGQPALTPRERDVLRLIASGRSNVEIADRLHIAEATVKTHINNLFAKIGVRDRAQAVT